VGENKATLNAGGIIVPHSNSLAYSKESNTKKKKGGGNSETKASCEM